MSGKTKIKTKTKTQLLTVVCKRACLMRAPYRVSSYPSVQINQINKNSSSNTKTKQQFPLIVKSSKEKTDEKVGAYEFSKYLSLINVIHIEEIFSEIIVIQYFE
jgi:hypothetical protein